jgi:hypothetical protein
MNSVVIPFSRNAQSLPPPYEDGNVSFEYHYNKVGNIIASRWELKTTIFASIQEIFNFTTNQIEKVETHPRFPGQDIKVTELENCTPEMQDLFKKVHHFLLMHQKPTL